MRVPKDKLSLTKIELAAKYGITKRVVEELMYHRKIPYTRYGHRTVRFYLPDVEKALARFQHKAVGQT